MEGNAVQEPYAHPQIRQRMLPHLFTGHMRDLLWILGALQSTDVGVCLDMGHAHLAGELDTAVEKLSGHLWLVHANDNRGENDEHLCPGDGSVDWRELARRLARQSFAGALVLELAGNGDAEQLLDRAARGRQYLEAILRAEGS